MDLQWPVNDCGGGARARWIAHAATADDDSRESGAGGGTDRDAAWVSSPSRAGALPQTGIRSAVPSAASETRRQVDDGEAAGAGPLGVPVEDGIAEGSRLVAQTG